jgi:2-polyprenyl-3-methyl-5-hydroxy-6-metoxy-1,4-benzoquinol methylase
MTNFGIKADYISRSSYTHHDDRGWQDQAQDEVYAAAFQIANSRGFRRIADIGCGSGFKLVKYFSNNFNTTGFEIEPTLSWLRMTYPNQRWEPSDFLNSYVEQQFDLLINADVIEHLVNPNILLDWIDALDFEILVLSTPDRDLLPRIQAGTQSQTGPPVNPTHVREWSFDEFARYIGDYFDIVEHFHTENEFWGQVIVAKKRDNSVRRSCTVPN